jgi:hypothetical protein
VTNNNNNYQSNPRSRVILKNLYWERYSRHYSYSHFMEHQVPLPHSQQLASVPCFAINPFPTLPRYLFIFNNIQLSSKERSSGSRSFSSSDPHAYLKEAAFFQKRSQVCSRMYGVISEEAAINEQNTLSCVYRIKAFICPSGHSRSF